MALPCCHPARVPFRQFLLGWKQDNNSQTFIASPYPLTWLSHTAKTGVITSKNPAYLSPLAFW